MNWDYISGKKENEKKHKKKKKTSITKIYDFFIRKLDSVLKKKKINSVIYLLFTIQTGK